MPIVLVLESQEMNVEYLAFVLRVAGYTVLRAKSGHAADTFLKYSCADIVIGEDEPKHGGCYDAMSRAAVLGIPMLVISDELSNAWGQMAESSFLAKPYSAADLIRKVTGLRPTEVPLPWEDGRLNTAHRFS